MQTSAIEVRAYQPRHLAMIAGREYEREMQRLGAAAGLDFARVFANGPGYTAFVDEVAVMAGGIAPTWRAGIGEGWMHISDWIYSHRRTAARLIRRMLSQALLEMEFHRVEAAICAEMEPNWRLVEFLGFQREGLMKRWGPDGRDYFQYAIVAPREEMLLTPRHLRYREAA